MRERFGQNCSHDVPTVSRASRPIGIGYNGASSYSRTVLRCIERSCPIMRGRACALEYHAKENQPEGHGHDDQKCGGAARGDACQQSRRGGRPDRDYSIRPVAALDRHAERAPELLGGGNRRFCGLPLTNRGCRLGCQRLGAQCLLFQMSQLR